MHSAPTKRVDLQALLNFYTQQKADMSTKQMPLPNSKDAPKAFDGRSLDFLPRFIDAVEQLFKMHSVTDKQQKKEYLVRYATPTIEDEWRGLETFANEFSFEDFKEEILDSYLETRDWSMGAFQRLQGLCARYRVGEGLRVMDFIQGFHVVGIQLKKENKMTSQELVKEFLATLEISYCEVITVRLRSTKQIKDALDAQRLHLDNLESNGPNAAAPAKVTRYK